MTTRLLDLWSPPDGAGVPVACLATTFTFEAEFFAEDCLGRFLSLSTVRSETAGASSIAALLEEEDRLSEAQVTVLVDRSSTSEKRNLRWDLLPVAVPGGLLHTKAAVLMWERATRVVIGSANLTTAGYRRQVEAALALELQDECQVPRAVWDDIVNELRALVELAPGSREIGPKARAMTTIDRFAERVATSTGPTPRRTAVRVAVAPGRPGLSPLAALDDVWKGSQPVSATVLSPFWDEVDPSPALEAIRRRLTGRGRTRRLTAVLPVDGYTGAIRAPAHLARDGVGVDTVAFKGPDEQIRALHAKCLLFESDDWIAAMVGSSNATTNGLGLDPVRGHRELNVWLGCPKRSREARELRALACEGDPVELADEEVATPIDEDEIPGPALPLGFDTCVVTPTRPPTAQLSFLTDELPEAWTVADAAGCPLVESADWESQGCPTTLTVDLPGPELPAFLVVRWQHGGLNEATWTANIEDRGALPPPAELAELPVSVLLAALASTRPLPVALEAELRRHEAGVDRFGRDELDPLKRFDDSAFLLQRTRDVSVALWGLKRRIERPFTSMDTLDWRLRGAIGPIAIGDGLVASAGERTLLPGEAHFLLAELALTVASVEWTNVAPGLDRRAVRQAVRSVVKELEQKLTRLGDPDDPAISGYARDAFARARR